jgi:hypothetical protein
LTTFKQSQKEKPKTQKKAYKASSHPKTSLLCLFKNITTTFSSFKPSSHFVILKNQVKYETLFSFFFVSKKSFQASNVK